MTGAAMTLIAIAVICLVAISAFGGAWLLMILLGALSHLIHAPRLAIGFWASFIICLIIYIFFGSIRKND